MYNDNIKGNQWYWYKSKLDINSYWSICYIDESLDGEYRIYTTTDTPTLLSKIDMDSLVFVSVGPPPTLMPQTIGDMVTQFEMLNPELMKK